MASRIDIKRKNAVLAAFIAVGAGLSLYGLYQYAFGMKQAIAQITTASHPLRDIIIDKLEGGRIFARFSLPGEYACFLAMIIPLAIGMFVSNSSDKSEKKHFGRALLLAIAGLLFINLLLTQSFGGIIVFVFAIAVAGALYFGRDFFSRKTAVYALAGFFIISFIILGIYFIRAPTGYDSPVSMRLLNWRVAVDIFKERPLTGAGWGGYGLEYPRFRTLVMNETQYAHNAYLQMSAEGGILVIPFILFFLWRWGKRAIDMARANMLDAALCAGVLAFLLYNLIDFQFYLPGVAYPFFILCGLFFADGKETKTSGAAERVGWVILLTAVLIATALIYSGEILYESATVAYEEEKNNTDALKLLARAEKFSPLKAEIFIYRAQIYLGTKNDIYLAKALKDADGAIALNPRTPFYYGVRGKILTRLGRLEDALKNFEQASKLYPVKYEYLKEIDSAKKLIRERAE